MYTSVIKKFEDKLVEVATARTTYVGRLSFHKHEDVLELVSEDKYTSKRYGSVFIDQNAVLAIREVKPVRKWDYYPEDCGEDDCCEQDKPKGYFKDEMKKNEEDGPKTFHAKQEVYDKDWLNKKGEPDNFEQMAQSFGKEDEAEPDSDSENSKLVDRNKQLKKLLKALQEQVKSQSQFGGFSQTQEHSDLMSFLKQSETQEEVKTVSQSQFPPSSLFGLGLPEQDEMKKEDK